MNYSALVPRDSFQGRYLSYMASQETAHAYDWWTGLWCIGAACARATYVARPRAPVYLNTFIVLVGESGTARKSTSVATATRIVRNMLVAHKDVSFLDAKLTPERLDLLLNDYTMDRGSAQLCIAVSELAVFLGTERYIAHMPTLLTDLYDCPDARDGGGTIARGAVIQRNIWVTFLSASTPVWLIKTVNPNVVEGGFTSRCYFIVSNEAKRSIPWPDELDTDLFGDVCSDLRIIAEEARKHGPILLDVVARSYFTRWYANRLRSIDPFKQSFEAREDAHVLRVAALLCVNDGSWIIRKEHLECATDLLSEIKHTSSAIFDTAVTQTKYAVGLDTIRSQLISVGMDPIARHRLYTKCGKKLTHDQFMSMLDILQELGAIQRFTLQEGRGRPAEYIRGTRILMSPKLGEHVLEHFT